MEREQAKADQEKASPQWECPAIWVCWRCRTSQPPSGSCINCGGPIDPSIDGDLEAPVQKNEERTGQERLLEQESVQVLFCYDCQDVVSHDPNGGLSSQPHPRHLLSADPT